MKKTLFLAIILITTAVYSQDQPSYAGYEAQQRQEMIDNIAFWVMWVIIVLIVAYALREVLCWYWKINRQIELLQETNSLLKKIVEQTAKEKEEPKLNKVTSSPDKSVNNEEYFKEVLKKYK